MATDDTLSFDPSSLFPATGAPTGSSNFTIQDVSRLLATPGQTQQEIPSLAPRAEIAAPRPSVTTGQDLSKYLNLSGAPRPQPTDTTDNIGGAPGSLQAGKGNRVDPAALYSYLRDQFAKSGVVNHVPADGARWGVNSGSPAEWAAFGLAVAKQESDLNTRSYNASDPGGSVGLFQFGQGQTQFTKGGNQFDPQQSANAFVRSVEQLVGQKGNIANLGVTFGSIRRPNEAGQYIPYAQKIAASVGTPSRPARTPVAQNTSQAPRDGNSTLVDLSRYLSM